MDLSEKRKGEYYRLTQIVLSGFFPIVTALSVAKLPGLVALGWSTLFAAFFFGGIVLYRRTWASMANPLLWRYMGYIVVFIGILFYGFYFSGLVYTTPGNAAVIALFEVFTSFIFFNVWRKEKISFGYVLGAALMLCGGFIVLAPNFSHLNIGDLMILAAVCAAPAGNLFQQKARNIASSEVIMFLRSALSAPVIFVLAYLFHQNASATEVRDGIVLIVINGVLILGLSKILWLEAIHRLAVTKTVALGSITPFLTLLFAWIILHQVPTVWQFTALAPLVLGVLFLTDQISLQGGKNAKLA